MSRSNKSAQNNCAKPNRNKNGKPYRQGKGGGNNGRPQSKPTADFEGREEVPVNKTKWYVASDSTKQAVERVSFNNIINYGYPIDVWKEDNTHVDEKLVYPAFATIMVNPAIEPTRGISKTNLNSSALNRVANMCYVQWSSMSGRTSNYSPADIAIYLLACGSIQAFISHIRRAIGLMRYYTLRNLAYPLEIMKALHVDVTGTTDKQVLEYIDKLNFQIRLFNAVKYPKNLEYFEKCNEKFDYIFKDSEGSYSQDFAFVPYSLWQLKEDYDEAGSGLETILIGGSTTNLSIPAMINMLDAMITELYTSTTQSLIGSDMLNYAMKKGMELGGIPELGYDYSVAPTYSAEACIQFHHVRPIGAPIVVEGAQFSPYTPSNDVTSVKVGQGAALFVQYAPNFHYSPGSCVRPIIDIDTDNPNVDEIVESRRYIAFFTANSPWGDTKRISAANGYLTDNYAVCIEIWGVNSDSGLTRWMTIDENSNYLTLASQATVPIVLSAFNHAPIIPVLENGYMHLYDQMTNIASLDDPYLTNVNHLEQIDLFTIRELQQFIKD